MKKFIASVLAVCCTLPLAACGGNGGEKNNSTAVYNVPGKNKTRINFTVYGGGLDGVWADIICEEFAKRYAETNFGGGSKKGVYIDMTRTYSVSLSGLSTSNQHIITATSSTSPTSLANSGDFYNLNDIVQDTSREGGSIDEALFSSIKTQLKGADGNYYALPYFEYYNGLQYNRTVFSEQMALFADDSDASALPYKSKFSNHTFKFTDNDGVLSKGPDGIKDTEDDGLPASMEELLVLMDYFKNRTDYYPVVVSGACVNYTDGIVAGLWSSLAGQQQMQNYYNSKGEVEVVSRDANGNLEFEDEGLFPGVNYIKKPKTKKIVLDETNGYLGADMVARYYAFSLIEIMQKENWFAPETQDGGVSHYDAQLALLVGNGLPRFNNSAMLVEYTYWYNETKNAGNFNQTKLIGKSEADFDVRHMCQPTSFYYNAEQTEESTALDLGPQYYMFVNNNITRDADVEAAVVEFVKFFYSEEILKKITMESGFPLSLEYELTDTELASMSTYAQHLWKLRKTDGSNIVFCAGDTEAHKLNRNTLRNLAFMATTDYAHIYSGVKGVGAATFFEYTAFKQGKWKTEE